MKQCLVILIFFISANVLIAQQTQQYYNYLWQKTIVDKALYYATIDNVGEVYYRRNFYLRDDRLQMDGFFKDQECKEKQGLFYYYYPTGNLEIICSYNKNKLEGRYMSFHQNGMMKDSAYYFKGNIMGNAYSWYANAMVRDSIEIYKDGSGAAISWHRNGQPSSGGYYAAGGKMRGTWQYFHFNGKPASREKYDNGARVGIQYFDENGNEQNDTANTDRAVSFPGGENEWIKYVDSHAIIPAGWENIKSGDITVVVSAVVDQEGNIQDAYVSAPFHPAFDKIALNLLQSSPQWIPAIEHHRKIEKEVRLPVTFSSAR